MAEADADRLVRRLPELPAPLALFGLLLEWTGWRPEDLAKVRRRSGCITTLEYKTQRARDRHPPLVFAILPGALPARLDDYFSRVPIGSRLWSATGATLRSRLSTAVGIPVPAYGLRVRRLRDLARRLPRSTIIEHSRHRAERGLDPYVGARPSQAQLTVARLVTATLPSPGH